MTITLNPINTNRPVPTEAAYFQTATEANQSAQGGGLFVWTFHNTGSENWLTAGVGISDVLGFVLLPFEGFEGEMIDLADDDETESTTDEE